MPSLPSQLARWPPGTRKGHRVPLHVSQLGSHNFTLAGTASDALGVPLIAAQVDLFRTGDNSWLARTTSDVTGAFSFTLSDNVGTFYVVVRDVTNTVQGVSANTLIAS